MLGVEGKKDLRQQVQYAMVSVISTGPSVDVTCRVTVSTGHLLRQSGHAASRGCSIAMSPARVCCTIRLSRYFARVMIVPTVYMAPILIAFTLVGSFVPRAYVFDMGVAIVFGVIGYIARRTGYHVAAILIGVILGPLLENYFLRALRISQGDLGVLFSSTIGNVLWGLLLLSLFAPALKKRLSRRG